MARQKPQESVALSKQAGTWLALLAALPVITSLISFRPDGQFAIWQAYARQLWLPAQVFEVSTIIIALAHGASIRQSIVSANVSIKLLAIIWFAFVLLATAFSERPNLALFNLVSWMLHLLFAISIAFLSRNWLASVDWQKLIATYLPVGSAVLSVLVVSFVMMVGLETEYDWISSLPGFPNIRHYGYFLMPAMALSAGMIAVGGHNARTTHMVLLAVNLGFTSWTGSRGPLVMFVITMILAFLIFSEMRRGRVLGMILLATVSGILLSQAVPTPNNSTFNAIMRIEEDKSRDVDQLSSGRTEIWRDTFPAVLEKPFIGHGGNQFRLQVPAARKTYNHPHNSLLQFAYDWGVIGAGAFLTMLLILAWRLLVTARAKPEICMPNCLAAISMAVFSLIDGVFYYNLPIMLFLTFALGTVARQSATVDQAAIEPLARKTQIPWN